MREQAERFGLEIQDKNVERVDLRSDHSLFGLRERNKAQSLIICTGAEAIWLGAEGEEEKKVGEFNLCDM